MNEFLNWQLSVGACLFTSCCVGFVCLTFGWFLGVKDRE